MALNNKQVLQTYWAYLVPAYGLALAISASLVTTLLLSLASTAQNAADLTNYQAAAANASIGARVLAPDYVAKFTPDFWQGAGSGSSNYLQPGSVLTGILQDKLSSKTSKAGDIFTIALPDGYTNGNCQLIAGGSKIVGVVVSATPAKLLAHGQPGRVELSLQTLVLPDGRSSPIYATIERNPNLDFAEDPSKRKKNPSLVQYAQSLKGTAYALVNSVSGRAIGMPFMYPGRTGKEFVLEPGVLLPIRLSRTLDLKALAQQPAVDLLNSALPTNQPQAQQALPEPF